MNNPPIVQSLLIAFALMVTLMYPYLWLLRRLGFGKQVIRELPHHQEKTGTPTMGGLLLIVVVIGVGLLLEIFRPTGRQFIDGSTFAPMATLALVGVLGAADDYLNARTGIGIRAVHKLLWQTVVALFVAWQIQRTYELDGFRVPFIGGVTVGAEVWIILAAIAIIGASNGVNITDGLDGLAGGTLIFAFIAYLVIALLNPPPITQPNLAVLCALIVGGLLGFLWFNVHPAQIIMGDSGALSLGAALAVIAAITGQLPILPLIGIVFVLETGSVILQVATYQLTGRRIFRMSPLHHHYEMGGWNEEKITMRFWIVGALAAMLGVVLLLASIRPELTA
ncbi:MAG TPA: phospho-N-acetylmuramoyl-pentapeptide-transferase [Candidatus Limnocylindrales bacterium]|nr:phospho-N-acetylmuramoyl-pentapeptide-transferase [Candidatus Limnocylindrales bacterium]